jgi:hypothetical protein
MTIISYNHSFAFIHIQKCGGTSIEKEWAKYVRWGDFVIGSTPEGEVIQPVFRKLYGLEKHTTATRLRTVIGAADFDRMRSLAVVREPLGIVESDYRFAHAMLDIFVDRAARTPDQYRAMVGRVKEMLGVPNHPKIPAFWYTHHRGAISAAILAGTFEDYLDRVADDRWHRVLADYVCDEGSRILVSNVLKLEEPDSIVAYFRQTLGFQDFELRWVNRGSDVDTRWPADLRRRLREICAVDYDLFYQ